jgi:hypothetical protein
VPVEIRELVIRAVVEDPGGADPAEPRVEHVDRSRERDELVRACVQQVLRVLRRNQER